MSVSFKKLCKYLNRYPIDVYSNGDGESLFDDVKFILKNQTDFSPDIIYVANTSMLDIKFPSMENISLILINNSGLNIKQFFENPLNIIEIKKDYNIHEVMNLITHIFMKETLLSCKIANLFKSFSQENEINQIINIASKILGNSLIVVDTSYRIISHSDKKDFENTYWEKSIEVGYFSYEFIVDTRHVLNSYADIKIKSGHLVNFDKYPTFKLVSYLRTESNMVGKIFLIESKKEISDGDDEILYLTAQAISKQLTSNIFYNNFPKSDISSIVYDVLESNIITSEQLEKKMKTNKIVFDDDVSIFTIDITNYSTSNRKLGHLSSLLYNIFPFRNIFYYKDYIVIVAESKNIDYDKFPIQRLKDMLSSNNLRIGVSRKFSSLLDCKKYFLEALKALNIGKIVLPDKHIICYYNVQFYDIIQGKLDEFKNGYYYHPALNKLKKYDERHETDYYNILYIYLKNNKNINKTSSELFIHRNTTRYHLQKIIDVIGTEISTMEELFSIYMSYKIDKYIASQNIKKSS